MREFCIGLAGCYLVLGLQTAFAQSGEQQISASGPDSSWFVAVGPEAMEFSYETPNYPLYYTLPAATMSRQGAKIVYRSNFANGDVLQLSIERKECINDLGETSDFTATISARSLNASGCASQHEYYGFSKIAPLQDLSMSFRIVNQGGPAGFALDLREGFLVLDEGEAREEYYRSADTFYTDAPWPVVEGGTARFDFDGDNETDKPTLEIAVEDCHIDGTVYPMRLALTRKGQTIRSCASHAPLVLDIDNLPPPPMMVAPIMTQSNPYRVEQER